MHNQTCSDLHELIKASRLYRFPIDPSSMPLNGIYLLFEEGEHGHSNNRIVRVGTHRGQDRLPGRIREHFLKENKDRSIFRKNIGRALLNKGESKFLEAWNLDLTSKANRSHYHEGIDLNFQREIERQVTEYIQERFSFVLLEVTDKSKRQMLEKKLISTISSCSICGPSNVWLGMDSPIAKIRESGLWNVQHLWKDALTASELSEIRIWK